MVKVITGLRRCGKSYLLGVLYKDYLLADGVRQDHIIEVALNEPSNCKYHNPLNLYSSVEDTRDALQHCKHGMKSIFGLSPSG